jgi:hypothetical protein
MTTVESLLAMLILVVIWRAHRLETRLADAADRQFKRVLPASLRELT